jgi:hypothetical protein
MIMRDFDEIAEGVYVRREYTPEQIKKLTTRPNKMINDAIEKSRERMKEDMGRFGKNGLKKRSAWQFEQPASRTVPLRYIPDKLAWAYAEAELPFILFIDAEKCSSPEMFDWCAEQFGEPLLSEQRPVDYRSRRRDRDYLQGKIATTDQTRNCRRMYRTADGGGQWLGWISLNPAVTSAFILPQRGTYWFFRTETQRIAFKLRWY